MPEKREIGRARSKETRKLIRKITEAGGVVERTANGHLRVCGPTGVALIGSDFSRGHELTQVRLTLRRYAGLHINM